MQAGLTKERPVKKSKMKLCVIPIFKGQRGKKRV